MINIRYFVIMLVLLFSMLLVVNSDGSIEGDEEQRLEVQRVVGINVEVQEYINSQVFGECGTNEHIVEHIAYVILEEKHGFTIDDYGVALMCNENAEPIYFSMLLRINNKRIYRFDYHGLNIKPKREINCEEGNNNCI